MAKNKEFKRQAEATRLLEKIGATRRKSRRAGITVTGELKESLRGRQSTDVANALKFTANTALDEAEKLYNDLIEAADNVEDKTSKNTGGILNICLNYGGQEEIIDASKKIALDYEKGKLDLNSISKESFYKYLYNDLEPIDLLIRTSGELRVSNFMLYQMAYSEFYFTDTYFPDFDEKELDLAIDEYNKRSRRFGGVDYETENN